MGWHAPVQPGEERHETFYSSIAKDERVQYDYRTPDGKLFSCIAKTLEQARAKRDEWVHLQRCIEASDRNWEEHVRAGGD